MNQNHETSTNNSTGPRTEAGKAKSRMNAFKTGLTGRVLIVSDWDLETWREFRAQGMAHYNPQNFEERTLVDSILTNEWRLQQWRVNECNRRNIEFERYLNQIDRDCAPAEEALAHAIAQEKLEAFIERTSRYESRLNRDISKAKSRLDEIQTRRKTESARELELAMYCRMLAKSENRPWSPEDDGFVLTLPQIDRHTRLHQALNQFKKPPQTTKAAA